MKRYQKSLVSDSAFLLLFILCFVCIVYTAADPNVYLYNIILLNIAFLICILMYFTTLTTGLIMNIVYIFGSGTYTMYQGLVAGVTISMESFFWLIMTPALTGVTWMLTYANRGLQEENEHLKQMNQSLATIDATTNLKNSMLFSKDAETFMALSQRYKIPLTLLIVSIRYWDEIKRMTNNDEMTAAVYELSTVSLTSIRSNDSMYMLDQEKPTWGLLLFTDREGANIVIDRLRDNVDKLNKGENAGKYKVKIDLKIGALEYNSDNIPTPLEFIVQAKKQIEYDV